MLIIINFMVDEINQNQNTQTPPPPQAPVPPPASGSPDNDKVMAIIGYLGILILVPLLAVQNRSAFLNYHLNQSLSLIITAIGGWVVLSFVGMFAFFLMPIWQILLLVLLILGIVNASKKEMKPLPIIGNWFHLIK